MAPQSFILSIVDIDPPMAWPDPGVNPTMQHSVVKVKFSLENRSDKQTFGFVNGKVTRGESLLELVLVGDGYMQNSAVVNVGPGHTAQGFLIMGS